MREEVTRELFNGDLIFMVCIKCYPLMLILKRCGVRGYSSLRLGGMIEEGVLLRLLLSILLFNSFKYE